MCGTAELLIKEDANMKSISVKITPWYCTCNACHARNYPVQYPAGIPRESVKVVPIYEVHIGSMVPALCEDCLRNLCDTIGGVLNNAEAD